MTTRDTLAGSGTKAALERLAEAPLNLPYMAGHVGEMTDTEINKLICDVAEETRRQLIAYVRSTAADGKE